MFVANLTDGTNGTGIERVTIRRGNGTLTTSTVTGAEDKNVTVATYVASCCSQSVELAAVDRVGNVGTCDGQARVSTAGGHSLDLPHSLWISVVVSLLWK